MNNFISWWRPLRSSKPRTRRKTFLLFWTTALILLELSSTPTKANPDAKRLYDDLLSDYNRLIRWNKGDNTGLKYWFKWVCTIFERFNWQNSPCFQASYKSHRENHSQTWNQIITTGWSGKENKNTWIWIKFLS